MLLHEGGGVTEDEVLHASVGDDAELAEKGEKEKQEDEVEAEGAQGLAAAIENIVAEGVGAEEGSVEVYDDCWLHILIAILSFSLFLIIHRPREAAEGLVVVEIIVGVAKRVLGGDGDDGYEDLYAWILLEDGVTGFEDGGTRVYSVVDEEDCVSSLGRDG